MLVSREVEKSISVFALFAKEMESLFMVNFKGRYFKKKIIQETADPFVECCKHDLVLNIFAA